MREETIVITSREDTGGIEAPAVTFSFTFFGKVGWRTVFENATVNYVNFKIVDHCESYDSIEQCVEEETFALKDLIAGVRFDVGTPLAQSLKSTTTQPAVGGPKTF